MVRFGNIAVAGGGTVAVITADTGSVDCLLGVIDFARYGLAERRPRAYGCGRNQDENDDVLNGREAPFVRCKLALPGDAKEAMHWLGHDVVLGGLTCKRVCL